MIKINPDELEFIHRGYSYLFITYDPFYYTDKEYEPILNIYSANCSIEISLETQSIKLILYNQDLDTDNFL